MIGNKKKAKEKKRSNAVVAVFDEPISQVEVAGVMDNDDDEFQDSMMEIVTKSSTKASTKKGFMPKISKFKNNSLSGGKYKVSNLENEHEPDTPNVVICKGKEIQDFTSNSPSKQITLRDDNEDEMLVCDDFMAQNSIHNEYNENQGNSFDLELESREHTKVEAKATTITDLCFHDEEDYEMPQVVVHRNQPNNTASMAFASKNPVIQTQNVQESQKNNSFNDNSLNSTKEAPIIVDPIEEYVKYEIVITAIGAQNLHRVQKFGSQSPYLEIKSEIDEKVVRTSDHKKGGSNATWNQSFTFTTTDLGRYTLLVTAKSNNVSIGECMINCHSIWENDGLHEGFFKIYDSKSSIQTGEIHLSIKVADISGLANKSTSPLPVPPVIKPFEKVNSPHIPILQIVTQQQHEHSPKPDKYSKLPPKSVLLRGGIMYKIPFHYTTQPKRQWFVVNDAPKPEISWSELNNSKPAGKLVLQNVTEIKRGHKTRAFWKQLSQRGEEGYLKEDLCFSLISKERTLDISASTPEEADLWVDTLSNFIGCNEHAEISTPRSDDYRTVALSPRVTDEKLVSGASCQKKKSKRTLEMQQFWLDNIFMYARNGYVSKISTMLSEGCPVDLMDEETGDTILMIACRIGNIPLVELCLKWQAKNDPHPSFGETALQCAVKNQQSSCARLLLVTAAKSDMDCEIVNHADAKMNAPIHISARNGDLKCLELLLHHGADISLVDSKGRTPLHCSVLKGHSNCSAYIVDFGGDGLIDVGDDYGNTPLHFAARYDRVEIVKMLLESAANVHSKNIDGLTAFDIAKSERKKKCVDLIYEYLKPVLESNSQPKNVFLPQELPYDSNFTAKNLPPPAPGGTNLILSPRDRIRGAIHMKQGSYENMASGNHQPIADSNEFANVEGSFKPYGPHPSMHSVYPQSQPFKGQYCINRRSVDDCNYHGDWTIKYTSEGYKYYVNSVTGISQWECPEKYGLKGEVSGSVNSFWQYNQTFTKISSSQVSLPEPTNSMPLSPNSVVRAKIFAARMKKKVNNSACVDLLQNSVKPPCTELSVNFPDRGLDIYYKMKSMGVSNVSIAREMISDGHDKEIIKSIIGDPSYGINHLFVDFRLRILLEFETEPNAKVKLIASKKKENSTKPQLSISIPSGNSKNVSKNNIKHRPSLRIDCDDKEVEELELLFSPNNGDSSFQKSRASSPKGRSKSIVLFDVKRGNNIAMELASYKNIRDYDCLVQSLINLDDNVFNIDQLQSLKRVLPIEKEKDLLSEFTGDIKKLGKAESFFLSVFKASSFEDSLDCFIFKLQFVEESESIKDSISTVKNCCEDVLNSSKLKFMFQKILAIEKVLQSDNSDLEEAKFKLHMLTNSSSTKSVDNATTILDFVISKLIEIQSTDDDCVLELSSILHLLNKAIQVPMPTIASKLKLLKSKLKKTLKFIESCEAENESNISEADTSIKISMSVDAIASTLHFLSESENKVKAILEQFNELVDKLHTFLNYLGEKGCNDGNIESFKTLRNFVTACIDSIIRSSRK